MPGFFYLYEFGQGVYPCEHFSAIPFFQNLETVSIRRIIIHYVGIKHASI